MAKYYGKIGFVSTVETEPGIWEETATERAYFGDVIRNIRRLESANKINSDLNISNQISILADPYLNQNLQTIRYVEFMGTKWKVESVEVQYPRLLLSLGGVYNE